jgi:superfamily I DNA/RNA helicase
MSKGDTMSICDKSNLTSEQNDVLDRVADDSSPSCIIEAVAGCGKTTVLLHFLVNAIANKKKVLFLAFNVSTVEWARRCLQLPKKCPSRGADVGVDVQTFHGFAYSMFPGRKLDPNVTFSAFSDAMGTNTDSIEQPGPKRQRIDAEVDKGDKQLWVAVRRIIQHIRCTGYTPDDYLALHGPQTRGSTETRVLNLAHKTLKLATSDVSNRMELEDTVYLAAVDSSIAMPMYDWVVVDEIQDANETQLIMLCRLLDQSDSSRILAVGDPKQSIYSFRHTNDAINGLRRRLASMERRVQTLNLSVCFRCPRSVINLARSIQPRMEVAKGAIEGTVGLHCVSSVSAPGLLPALLQRAATSSGQILCIMRYNKPILQILWAAFQRSLTDRTDPPIGWLSASVLRELRDHLQAMLGINEEDDGDLVDILDECLLTDRHIYNQWQKYKRTRSAHVWDMNPVVRQALDQSCTAAWYTFLLSHIRESVPDNDNQDTNPKVIFSTIHYTKGITFRGIVAIFDYNAFGAASDGGNSGTAEDSHLLYVALTRTTKGLLFVFTQDPYRTISPYFQVDDIQTTIQDLETYNIPTA